MSLDQPSSHIKGASSNSKFVIEETFKTFFGSAEYRKWRDFPQTRVKVRSVDSVTRYEQNYIASITGNTITLNSALGFTPQAGDFMELAQYDVAGLTDEIKLRYGHMTPGSSSTFTVDGSQAYQML